ncbi:retrovirus-related pol polyprotein from transposon TNT 1-94 [Tanacetum coccineum]
MRGEKVAANLYQLKGEIIEEAEASVASHSLSYRVAVTWYQKLGHMSEQEMKILVERKLLSGLTKVFLPFCEHCVISKQHRLKFKTSNSRSVYVLELVHFDVWQAPVLSLGGANLQSAVELDSGKKIKCLRMDNGGEYTGDEFDTFCRQEEIKRQFTTAYTPQQNGVAERMNRTLLERARAMLATTSLGKSFWAKVVNTACYVINPSTAVELKTPMEMWTGTPVNYYDIYLEVLWYADGVRGYCLWDPTTHKLVVSGDVVFMKDKIQENEEGDSTTRESTSIQMEKEFQSNDSFEAAPQHEVNETNESQALATRTLNQEGEPSTLQEALNNLDASFWKEAMQEEIDAIHKNKTWELVPLPGGYAQKEGINFNAIFSHVVRMTTIRMVLAMYATYDLHLEQLDVKTAFLHGNLEEEIYMLQPEGFKQKGKENLVCRLNKSLYGLKQAPRCWYKRFDSFIRSLEYNRLHADPYAYFKRFGNDDFIILLLYVDDMLVAGPNKDHINKLKAQLAREFEMKGLGLANKILGMQIHRDRVSRKIWLSQKSYVKKILQRFNMQDCKPISTTFPTNVKLSSNMMGVVIRYMAEPGREHWEAVKKILRYIKGTFRSGFQNVVAMSTTEAEYVAAAQASKEAIKHIRVQYHFVREKVEEGTVDMQKIHTDDNVADYLTKSINCDKFIWCRSSCGLAETPRIVESMDQRTDIVKISRKQSKPDKHEHGNRRAHKEPGECYQGQQKSTYGQQHNRGVLSWYDLSATCHFKDGGPSQGLYFCRIVLRYRCVRTELITPDLACPSTHQLLRNSGGDSGPNLSFDKSASP